MTEGRKTRMMTTDGDDDDDDDQMMTTDDRRPKNACRQGVIDLTAGMWLPGRVMREFWTNRKAK